jgi:hypothetical protein
MITWIPYRGYGTVEQREKPPRNESFTQSEFIRLLFLQAHRETDRFFAASGVQLAQTNPSGQLFHFRRAGFLQQLKSKVDLALAKAAALRINLNVQTLSKLIFCVCKVSSFDFRSETI